ncbi:MAG: SDR family oxidoreductase [Natronospirillum sp.]|uniref:SDR family oxidoreductase n=1 Tax=Natronospirillum sp. TaxID=2812955 RepID=UPI0025ED2FC0|nr:SDR family oxidoreductase [Natronospirillum sp.]MCH8552068.1 SDR family oxidoreductase [Natronospirillum sp.]
MAATALITGANRGIGLAMSQQLAASGHDIIGVCRESSPELDKLAKQVISGIDVTRESDVVRMKATLGDSRLDLLINNAGMMEDNRLGDIEYDSLRRMMEVNAYAPLMVTEALLDHLGKGSKVGLITSRMGSIADNDSGGRYGYRASKAALNAFGKSLAIDLKPRGVAVALLHPGYVKTRMVNFGGMITPEESAAGLIARMEGLTLDTTGTFWHSNGEVLPW